MTAFILVPDAHTGDWVWHEVAAGLRESGAEAHPVTLTGMDGEAAPETDLDTHIQDVVRLIDTVTTPDVVIVGHGYGIHPALGAAGLRPERSPGSSTSTWACRRTAIPLSCRRPSANC